MNNMDRDDLKDWTSTMICAKMRELENAFEQLQKEYTDKKSQIVHDYNLLQTVLSNREIADKIMKG